MTTCFQSGALKLGGMKHPRWLRLSDLIDELSVTYLFMRYKCTGVRVFLINISIYIYICICMYIRAPVRVYTGICVCLFNLCKHNMNQFFTRFVDGFNLSW